MLLNEGRLATACLDAKLTVDQGMWSRIADEIQRAPHTELSAYLAGAMHDGTFNALHGTVRIAQADLNWMQVLGHAFEAVGARRWFYREGDRRIYVVESSFIPTKGDLKTRGERSAYARGYFDAEGGTPRDTRARFYLQFCQKDLQDLVEVRDVLESLGIATGRVHNPSRRVDPAYWRFYVRSKSFARFIATVRSWHPRKRELLEARVPNPQTSQGSIVKGRSILAPARAPLHSLQVTDNV